MVLGRAIRDIDQHEVGVLEFCDLDYSDTFDGRVGSY